MQTCAAVAESGGAKPCTIVQEAQDLYRVARTVRQPLCSTSWKIPSARRIYTLRSKLNSTNHDERMSKYMDEEPSSVLILYTYDDLYNLFDEGNYEAAVVSSAKLTLLAPEAEQSECIFKKAYSFFLRQL